MSEQNALAVRIRGYLADLEKVTNRAILLSTKAITSDDDGYWDGVALNLNDDAKEFTFLIHDNDKKFTSSFDLVFSSEKVEILHTPFQAPRANSFAERWVRSVREECLDQILILNENHLQRVLKEYDQYYNHARPHQGIGQRFPVSVPGREQNRNGPIRRRNILGGIIHDYQRQPSSQVYTNG